MKIPIKHLFCFIIISAGTLNGNAQSSMYLDSLDEVDQINDLHESLLNTWMNEPDQSMRYGEEALKRSKGVGNQKLISKSLRLIAGIYYNRADYNRSMDFNLQALEIANELNDSSLINNGYNNIGLIHYNQGGYQTALEYLLRSINIKEELGESYGFSLTLNNIGLVYEEVGMLNTARNYFQRGFDYAVNMNDSSHQVYSLNNIGRSYLDGTSYDKARDYFNRGFQLAEEIGNIYWGAFALRGMGESFHHYESFDSAKYYYEKALAGSESVQDKKGISESYYLLSKLAFDQGDFDESLAFLDKGHELASQIKTRQQMMANLKLYTAIYSSLNKKKHVVANQASYISLKDSLFLDVMTQNLSLVPLKLEEENTLLKLTRQEAEIKTKEELNRTYTFVLVALGPVIIFFVVLIRKNKKANEDLMAYNIKLKDTQALLVKSEKMASLGVLAAGIGHEINNPLNFIKNGVLALISHVKKEGAEGADKYVEIIEEGVNRSSNIVNSLSHFSRSNSEMEEDCDIHNIIQNCLLILKAKMDGSIEVVNKFDIRTRMVKGNEGKLHQVFMSILGNAIQSMKDGGELSIETGFGKKAVTIQIQDTGEGIEKENLLRITDPFFTTKSPGDGAGLGLFITQSIIDEHEGTLSVESENEKGSLFTITLPLK